MRRGLWWAGVFVALAAVVSGAVVAYRGYVRSDRPEQIVRAYYAALGRGDAPAALGYGSAPASSRTWLTSAVLQEQQRIAPMSDVTITRIERRGLDARVAVRYVLGFADRAQVVTDSVSVHAQGRTWRLDRAAIRTRLRIGAAADRIEFAGGAVPAHAVTLFPGALPLRSDTTALRVVAGHDALTFASGTDVDLAVELTAAGRRAAQDAVFAALQACLSGHGSVTCPTPGGQYVPGSVRGTLVPNQRVSSTLGTEPAGVVEATASLTVDGTYRRLTFQNVPVAGTTRMTLPVRAKFYATRPQTVVWSTP